KVVQPVTALNQGEVVAGADVTGGKSPAVNLCAAKSLEIRLDPDDLPKLEKKIIIQVTPAAPVRQGQQLGECVCLLRGQELGRVSLVAEAGVPRRGWPGRLWDKLSN
ncbi:MAG: D-alanyl-D-alanine carboxypeptidase, partial [Desulfotomaculaceae bacterium]